MNRLLISYDLVTPGRDYNNVFQYLKSFPKWVKPLRSLWVIKTSKSCEKVRDELVNLVDRNDRILVVDITGCGAAWYNIAETNWIRNSQ